MTKPRWDSLVEQLQDPDPRVRRRACEQLAATREPQVIPFLKNAYVQEDDERVRRAAYDALARFRAMQQGSGGRALPISDRWLNRVFLGLAGLLLISLIAHGAVFVAGSLGKDDSGLAPTAESTIPSERQDLVNQIGERLQQAQEDASNLQLETGHHNNTNEVICQATYHKPQQLALSQVDRTTYRDLALVTDRLNLALFQLQQPQMIWDRICATQKASLTEGLKALATLDQVQPQLAEIANLLQNAIAHPAPTFGPTITPLPTATLTPTLTPTPAPGTTPAPTATALPSPTPTITPTPSISPTPSPTPLPYPALDYTALTRDLSSRFVVLGDLQNSYGSGMIDRWQQAQAGDTLSTAFCTLSEWPGPVELSAEQTAALQQPGVADPELEQAIQRTNDGLALAVQARALYEPSCLQQTLSSTADQGIALAQQALEKLSQAETLVKTIRKRK